MIAELGLLQTYALCHSQDEPGVSCEYRKHLPRFSVGARIYDEARGRHYRMHVRSFMSDLQLERKAADIDRLPADERELDSGEQGRC